MGKQTSFIDVRSDTVTMPSSDFFEAMQGAANDVGDMVMDDDSSVKSFHKIAAKYFGFEDCLICTTGTQANLISILTHCQRGDSLICGQESHIYKYETGGLASLGSVLPEPVEHAEDGGPDLAKLIKKIKPVNIHFAPAKAIAVENPIFGKVWPFERMEEIYAVAKEHKLQVHYDGARIHNAAIALGRDVKEFSNVCDSVMVCLTKSLGAPIGSLLLGSSSFIRRARHHWKMVGGGLRQGGGMIAACAKVALGKSGRISIDHERARATEKLLVEACKSKKGVSVDTKGIRTNMVMMTFEPDSEHNSATLQNHFQKYNIKAMSMDLSWIRIAFHLDLTDEGVRVLHQAIQEW